MRYALDGKCKALSHLKSCGYVGAVNHSSPCTEQIVIQLSVQYWH